jgi:hypothetical protein
MATTTPVLGLVLPGNGEFTDDWDQPINNNATIIDTTIGTIQTLLQNAAGSTADLTTRLAVSLNPDGTLLPVPDILAAQNSFLFGYVDPANTPTAYTLKQQIDNLGKELWYARAASATLLDALAAAQFGFPNQIVSGTQNVNGYPTYISNSSNIVRFDGSVTPIVLMIGGYTARVRTLAPVTISGAAGTYYIYAARNIGGVVVVDDSTGTANGATSADGLGNMSIFTDSTEDFTTLNVNPGDLLTITDGNDAGAYLISAVAPAGYTNFQLQIVGHFPIGNQSGAHYTITDPLAPTLSAVISSGSAPANSIIIGEADFDGTAVTASRPRAYRNDFVGEWRSVTVAGPQVLPEQIFNHWLGTDKIDVVVQVSQANDGSAPVEEISLSQLVSSLGVSLNNTLGVNVTNGTLAFTPGSGGGSLGGSVAGNLTGGLSSSLTGSVGETRSLAMQWDRNQVKVKGLTSGVLYTDYNGVVQTGGYLRVLARRRG